MGVAAPHPRRHSGQSQVAPPIQMKMKRGREAPFVFWCASCCVLGVKVDHLPRRGAAARRLQALRRSDRARRLRVVGQAALRVLGLRRLRRLRGLLRLGHVMSLSVLRLRTRKRRTGGRRCTHT